MPTLEMALHDALAAHCASARDWERIGSAVEQMRAQNFLPVMSCE